MKIKTCFLSILFATLSQYTYSQANCGAVATGYTPINDLGTGISPVTGLMGGLYPSGSNFVPPAHKNAGLLKASQVQCLDANGNPDAVNGKIVWLSIGMSNATQETQQFIPQALAFSGINPNLKLVDGAKFGQVASIISTPSNPGYQPYWDTVSARLSTSGVTANQVQVVWFKNANIAGSTQTQTYHDSLVVQYKRIMNELKTRFPNVKICYMASRISARYASVTLNPEPYAYWQGWAVKKVIEDQINGDAQLQHSGTGTNSPWLSWGIYMWSDGSIPQTTNPNVFWDCPADFNSDGTHPSIVGRQKVGSLLLNFFTTDSTATPWFLGNGCSLTGIDNNENKKEIKIFPNPASSSFAITVPDEFKNFEFEIMIYNSLGQHVYQEKMSSPSRNIQISTLSFSSGMYNVVLKINQVSFRKN